MVSMGSREAGCGTEQRSFQRLITQPAKFAPMHWAGSLTPLHLQHGFCITSSKQVSVMTCDSAWELYTTLGILCIGKGLKLSDKQVLSYQISIPKHEDFPHRNTLETALNLRTFKEIIESENGLGWKGPQRSSGSNRPAMSRDISHQTRLLRAPSNLALNTAREGAYFMKYFMK